MNHKTTSWEGTIRLRPKNPSLTVDILLRDYFNFGEYGELREKVVFDSWSDACFGELRFSTQTKLGGLDEVRYWFTPGDNKTDKPNISFLIEIQHLFITSEKCYLLGQANLVYHAEEEFSVADDLIFGVSVLCEFENINGIQLALKRLSKKNYFPTWENNFKRILNYEWDSTAGTTILGCIRLHYMRTTRYLFHYDRYHYYVAIKKNEPRIECEAHIRMQKCYRDFDLLFQSPTRKELEEINSVHLSKSYSSMMVDETEKTGPCMYIEQTILLKNYVFIMGVMRLMGRKNEYDYYKFSFKCNSSDLALAQINHSFQISSNDYWNLEEIDIDTLLQQHLLDKN